MAEAALLVAVLVGLGIANYRLALQAPGGNDFLARWVGANQWLVSGRNPYDPQVSLVAQTLIYGRPADRAAGEDVAHFAYPLFSMLFFGPFGLLPYPLARAVWMTILEVSLPVLAIFGMRLGGWRPSVWIQRSLILFSVLWYHGFRAVILGQFAVLEALLITGALLAIQRREDGVAGVLIGLSLAKPQMTVLLLPFLLLWAYASRRFSILIWALGTIAVLLGGSLALIPDWPIQWVRQILDYTSYTAVGPPVSILAGLIPSAAAAITTVLTGLAVLYLILEWVRAWGKGDRWFQWTAALTIVMTNLIALRTATTNYVVILPALILIFSVLAERWGPQANVAILMTLGILFIGIWAQFLATVEGNQEHSALYLPVPLLALAGLWWSKWWVVRQVRF
ncbi:MAG: glycosyltransferase family 87 protein [Chloroflexota bacterium]